ASWIGATTLGDILLWPGAVLAVCSAVYTAFLFAQAKGRDFWQNPLLSVHLLAHALLAGGAVWLVAELNLPGEHSGVSRVFLIGTLVFSFAIVLAEIFTAPPTADAHRALQWILKRPMGKWFWGMGIGVGHLLPLALLIVNSPLLNPVAALAT